MAASSSAIARGSRRLRLISMTPFRWVLVLSAAANATAAREIREELFFAATMVGSFSVGFETRILNCQRSLKTGHELSVRVYQRNRLGHRCVFRPKPL